jgi:hypothetical protein
LTIAIPNLLALAVVVIFCQVLGTFGIDYQSALKTIVPMHEEQLLVSNRLVDTVYVVALAGVSLYIWTAAFGVNRKDEVSAGAVALLVMLAWWLLLSMLWSILLERSTGAETARLRAVGIGSAPAGLLALRSFTGTGLQYALFGLASALAAHGLLAAWYVRRFGRDVSSDIRSPRSALVQHELMDWLAPPRRRPITAIVWKQFRETAPIAVAGLLGIVATVLIFIVVSYPTLVSAVPNRLAMLTQMFVMIAVAFGFVIAIVAGIGVFYADSRPGINAFWRSRPIHADLWFWTKFLVGLAIVLAVIYVPAMLVSLVGPVDIQGILVVLALIAGQMASFAAALAMTCLVRHAVYAAILSFAFIYLSAVAVWVAILVARRAGWVETASTEFADLTEGQTVVAMLVSFVVSMLVAWLAVRYDWGRKSRY